MADITALRKDLLEEAMEYLEERHSTQKKFAKMFLEEKLKLGLPIESYGSLIPQMYTPQEAIEIAKIMEGYIVGITPK